MLKDAIQHELEPRIVDKRYTVILKRGNVIDIKERLCKDCGALLYLNGYNVKMPVLDRGLGRRTYLVQRRRCPRCGEIRYDLSAIAAPSGHYHENYKRRARLHFMNGLNPARIQAAMHSDYSMTIPRTTLVGWIRKARQSLRDLLASAKLPLSGHWHHDETFLRVGGKKAYALDTIDAVTGFVPAVTVTTNNDRYAATKHFSSIRRDGRTPILSLVMDGTAKLGTLLKTRSFKHVQRGQCNMHFKWRVGRKLKRLAGMGESSMKPLPKQFHSFRQRFYDVFDSHDETGAYIALERLRPLVEQANKKYLTTLFKDIEAKLPQIIAWQRNPAIAPTNNKCENFHQRLQYHTSFKTRARTMEGAQAIADFRVFNYNFKQFNSYTDDLWRKRCTYKARLRENPGDPSLKGGTQYYFYEIGRVNRAFGEYMTFWDEYLALH
jgi:transposase-like protein